MFISGRVVDCWFLLRHCTNVNCAAQILSHEAVLQNDNDDEHGIFTHDDDDHIVRNADKREFS